MSLASVMPGTILKTGWQEHASPAVDPSAWTAVIAAAGKGSRLGFHLPKILYPVAERPILAWLLDLLLPNCATVVLVLSPDGVAHVQPELERLAKGRYRIAVQEQPTGMGDAVEVGAACAGTLHTAVIWGDQVAIRPGSIETMFRIQQGPLMPDLTIPTVLRSSPYIHFPRDASGAISGLCQAREGDVMPETGESDTGLFCFKTAVLRDLLKQLRNSPEARGNSTSEFNLLPAIPFTVRNGFRLITPQTMDVEETVGINCPADAKSIESYLRSRQPGVSCDDPSKE